jgi:hypothetical protein
MNLLSKIACLALLMNTIPASSQDRVLYKIVQVASDYPGFGHSSWPSLKDFSYTFDHLLTLTA